MVSCCGYEIWQGGCLTGARTPEAPTIYSRATKISNRERERAPKTYDSQANFQWTNNKIPAAHSALWNDKLKRLIVGHRQRISPLINGKHTALCLEICFCDFPCRVVKVPHLKMASNEFNNLRKNFNNKIMTFPSGLEMSGRYCMKSKLAKSRGPWKSKLVSNYTWHRWFP